MDPDKKCDILRVTITCINAVCHVLVLLITVYLGLYSVEHDLSKPINLHVLFCTLGYVLLMSEAIMALTDENISTKYFVRRKRSHIHWILQVTGAIFSISGAIIEYVSRDGRKPHFATLHSQLGLASLCGILILSFSGVPTLFAAKIRKTIRPVITKFIHNFLGISCYLLGMTALILSYEKGYFKDAKKGQILSWCIFSTYVVTIFSLIGAIRSSTNQIAGIFSMFDNE